MRSTRCERPYRVAASLPESRLPPRRGPRPSHPRAHAAPRRPRAPRGGASRPAPTLRSRPTSERPTLSRVGPSRVLRRERPQAKARRLRNARSSAGHGAYSVGTMSSCVMWVSGAKHAPTEESCLGQISFHSTESEAESSFCRRVAEPRSHNRRVFSQTPESCAAQSRADHSRAEPSRAEHCRALQSTAEHR